MAKAKNKSWYMRWWAIVLFIFIGLLILGGLVEENNPIEEKKFSKSELKTEIERIGLYSEYMPKVSSLTFKDNLLFIEYSSFENNNERVFDEQQKVSEEIVQYFQENNIQEPNEVLLRVNGITNEYTEFYPTFETTLSWSKLIKMANLELEYSSWLNSSNNAQKLK